MVENFFSMPLSRDVPHKLPTLSEGRGSQKELMPSASSIMSVLTVLII